MGKIFELIADEVLIESKYSSECSFCGKSGVPIYPVTGYQIEPGQYVFEDVPDSLADTEKDEACCSCLHEGKVKHFSEWQVEKAIKEYCANPINELLRFRRNPIIPLFLQGLDWVICCGEMIEFIGSPKDYDETIFIGETFQFWDRGPKDWKTYWSFEFTLEPESLDEVSKFFCKKCGKKWFIWQCT